jgi:hypothetical protein
MLNSLGKLLTQLCQIEIRGESVLIMGDLNRAVWADELVVPGNKVIVSPGGELVRKLMTEGEYFLLHSHYWTQLP